MSDDALLVIDMQNDFCPGGALAVAGGDEIVGTINTMMAQASLVVLTQDWHPANHSSFASQHPGAEPFEVVDMPYGAQVLWPDHCIQGSEGAAFHPGLHTDPAHLVVRKGFRPTIDSYSAFFENDRLTPTGLTGYLSSCGVGSLTLVGLATDYCVLFSALDAVRMGFETTVDLRACRGINLDGSLADALESMENAGVRLLHP